MAADDIPGLLGQLDRAPNDAGLRARTADALDAAGRRDEALEILAPLVNVTGHDDDAGLPCLCKLCLPRAGDSAEAAGMQFRRSFAVANDRVLHFWSLRELDREPVKRSVAQALGTRLALGKRSKK